MATITPITIPSSGALSYRSMVVFQEALYWLDTSGRLVSYNGTTVSGFLTQAINCVNLLVFNNQIYANSTSGNGALRVWNGSNAWITLHSTLIPFSMTVHNGAIYCYRGGTTRGVYSWTGTTWSLYASITATTNNQFGQLLSLNGNLYCLMDRYDLYLVTAGTFTLVAPAFNPATPSSTTPFFVRNNTVCIAPSNGSNSSTAINRMVYEWNGVSAWTGYIPLPAGAAFPDARSAIVFEDMTYIGGGLYTSGGVGKFRRWDGGEEVILDAVPEWGVERNPLSLGYFNGALYALVTGSPFTLFRITDLPSPPAEIFPIADTGTLSESVEILYPIVPSSSIVRELHRQDSKDWKVVTKPGSEKITSTLKFRIHTDSLKTITDFIRDNKTSRVDLRTPGAYPFGNNFTRSIVYIISYTRPYRENQNYWRMDITYLQIEGVS